MGCDSRRAGMGAHGPLGRDHPGGHHPGAALLGDCEGRPDPAPDQARRQGRAPRARSERRQRWEPALRGVERRGGGDMIVLEWNKGLCTHG